MRFNYWAVTAMLATLLVTEALAVDVMKKDKVTTEN